ncbi:MAG: universal stress protein [Allosphingosinicella sp.]
MKNVLLLVHKDAGQEARFQAALDLARALNGHLICVEVMAVPFVAGDFDAGYAQTVMTDEVRAREAQNRKQIEDRLALEDVPWDWIEVTGSLGRSLNEAAGMADIIVVNRKLDSTDSPDMRSVAGEVVIGSGKAVVAVPEQARSFMAAGRAMVAWDGSDEARKALQGSVPLLRLARTVAIVEVAEGPRKRPAEDAAAYLSRHDIPSVVVHRRHRDALTEGDQLLLEAEAEGADYIVMGGFGHHRFVEAIFGGVSRAMLGESPIPLVISH